jgi:hypothetical protein
MKKLPFQIVSQEKRQARVDLNLRVSGFTFGGDAPPATTIADIIAAEQSRPKPQELDGADPISRLSNAGRVSQEAPEFQTIDDLKPKPSDFIHPLFRALSATLIEGYWLDYSKPGVLQAAVPLLQGQTVFEDHRYWRVRDWVGVVSKTVWDDKGEESNGVPGLNAELKIDWKKNPWIARGLMMTPPAIHSVSVTVLFEFDFSHPELVEQGRFWDLLGEEVEGHIVRLIVTRILGFWELSLVFQGADALAKKLAGEQETGVELTAPRGGPIKLTKENGTVKLTAQQKAALGLTALTGDDVPEGTVLQAVEGLAARAEAGDKFVTSQRAECLRVAKLAKLGAEDGTLPAALANSINKAEGDDLAGLITMYTAEAEQRFPQTCQHCGSKDIKGRSSVEERSEVEKLGQPKGKRKPAPSSSVF